MVTSLESPEVFPVTHCFVESKSNNLYILIEAVLVLKCLMNREFNVSDHCKTYDVILNCVLCGAPARALVKCIQVCPGYFGFNGCTQRANQIGRKTYPELDNLEPRTNVSLKNQTNPGHNHGKIPFTDLPTYIVKHFPIDHMH